MGGGGPIVFVGLWIAGWIILKLVKLLGWACEATPVLPYALVVVTVLYIVRAFALHGR
jgi:hypothetical protein